MGNVNLVSVGDYDQPKARFAGSFGSSYLYYVVPKVTSLPEHTRRTLVDKVTISAPDERGQHLPPRRPDALITSRCLFAFDRAGRSFSLASVHPGHSVAEVVEHTGFEFGRADHVPETSAPPRNAAARARRSRRRLPKSIRVCRKRVRIGQSV